MQEDWLDGVLFATTCWSAEAAIVRSVGAGYNLETVVHGCSKRTLRIAMLLMQQEVKGTTLLLHFCGCVSAYLNVSVVF